MAVDVISRFPSIDSLNNVASTHVFDFEPFVKAKTEICPLYTRGACHKGASCPSRHIRTEGSLMCKHWLRGLCKKGDGCEYLHEYNLKKMQECWFFLNKGECTNVDCVYQHIDPESKVKECPWYNRGKCAQGPNCRNRHVRKEPCQLYLTGFCPRGPTCLQGHIKAEPPTPDELGQGSNYREKSSAYSAYSVPSHIGGGGPGGYTPNQRYNNVKTMNSKYNPASAGTDGNYAGVVCYACGEKGHKSNECRNAPLEGRYRNARAPQTFSRPIQSVVD